MSELLIAKGKLVELEKQLKEIEIKSEFLFIRIRELLSPYYEFKEMEIDKILLLIKEFRQLQINYRNILLQIDKIKSTYNL